MQAFKVKKKIDQVVQNSHIFKLHQTEIDKVENELKTNMMKNSLKVWPHLMGDNFDQWKVPRVSTIVQVQKEMQDIQSVPEAIMICMHDMKWK